MDQLQIVECDPYTLEGVLKFKELVMPFLQRDEQSNSIFLSVINFRLKEAASKEIDICLPVVIRTETQGISEYLCNITPIEVIGCGLFAAPRPFLLGVPCSEEAISYLAKYIALKKRSRIWQNILLNMLKYLLEAMLQVKKVSDRISTTISS
jgi:hypothetical protein